MRLMRRFRLVLFLLLVPCMDDAEVDHLFAAFLHVADNIFKLLSKNEAEEVDGHGDDQSKSRGQKGGLDISRQFSCRYEMAFLADFVKNAHEAQKSTEEAENRGDVAQAGQNLQTAAKLGKLRHVRFIRRMAGR